MISIESLTKDMQNAMRAKDTVKVMTIRSVITMLTNQSIANGRSALSYNDILSTIKKAKEMRLEAASMYKDRDASRYNREISEVGVLDSYLPAMATEEEITAYVHTLVSSGLDKIGPIMKELQLKFGATLDGKVASSIVKNTLDNK